MPEFASMLTRVTRAFRRCSGSAAAATGAPVSGSYQQRGVVAGGEAELGPPRAQPVKSARRRQLAKSHREQCRRVRACRQQRPAHLIGACHHRLAQEVGTQLVQLADRLAVEGPGETGLGGHAAVDRVGGEVVLQHHLGVRTPGSADTAS